MAEEHGSTALVRNTVRAEQAGFGFARFRTISSVARRTEPCAWLGSIAKREGTTVDELASVTGWERHTVRGVFSGTY